MAKVDRGTQLALDSTTVSRWPSQKVVQVLYYVKVHGPVNKNTQNVRIITLLLSPDCNLLASTRSRAAFTTNGNLNGK